MINNLVAQLGGTRIPFLQEDHHWLISYLAIGVWQRAWDGARSSTWLPSAALTRRCTKRPSSTGRGDGGRCGTSRCPRFRVTIVTLLILNLGKVMEGSFERVFALQNKATTEFTTTIPVLVYRSGIESGNFSRATALGLFQALIGLAPVLAAHRIAKRLGEDGLL